MSDNKRIGLRIEGKKIKVWQIIAYALSFSILIFASSLLQTTWLSVFGCVPALTLAIICAMGFICGEKVGALSGIFAGALIDILGGGEYSMSPLLFMLCGYMCGVFVGWFLSKNLPSFIFYAAFAGILREIFTIVYFILSTRSFSILPLFGRIVIPEYFAYILCIIPAYGAVFGIYRLFKGKDNKEKTDHWRSFFRKKGIVKWLLKRTSTTTTSTYLKIKR